MALIKCPKCGKEFSDRALVCPQCGYQTDNSKKNKRFVIYGIVLLVIILLGTLLNPIGTLQLPQPEPVIESGGAVAYPTVGYSGYWLNLLLACYFIVFWVRQAKSMKNTSVGIYAYVIAVLSFFIVGWKFGLISPSDWIYCVYFALLGIAFLLYGVKSSTRNKSLLYISGSLWLCASIFMFVCLFMINKGSMSFIEHENFFMGGVMILPSVSIISTILFIISCYLPDLKKKTLQN